MREKMMQCESGGRVFNFIQKGQKKRKESTAREQKQLISTEVKDRMNRVQNLNNS